MTSTRTAREQRLYYRTLKGAYERAFKCTYDPERCMCQIEIIAESCMKESQKRWLEAVEQCGGDSVEALLAAEHLMGSWGYYPPHFTYEGRCKRCGPVLTPYPQYRDINECIFCATGYAQQTEEIIQEIKNAR